ncbi:PREDICTED: GPI ethanolamine phosphate transferase 3 isoform X3 [Brassica oleracea var. oleracea]|nr:PREDICTED: GPI ethanolamine phosphate transferase 3 isoform X3 [Brassica oleracea var. oleracea]
MMGDDTWTQLFPNQFHKSYPFPSFNVKDLDTVDNGCIEHLFPTLYKDDWDVLIAHFLGVDHAGHIFGVDSMPMINKLEQYNTVLERVVDILESQAGPGGVHENTMLIVMGDHGQTLNGDHGGGTAEEVETTMFAMSTKKHTTSVPPEFDTSSCKQDPDGKQMCISSIEQLDFAATLSALLGISFPFGSIGHVNPELYALGSSSLNLDNTKQPAVKEWMKSYVNVLCVNAWQVKRYIDVYSNSSVVGFSSDDMSRISNLYSAAEHNWSNSVKHILMYNDGNEDSTNTSALKAQIAAYLKFFSSVAELARSKWTEFNLSLMITGFGILVISLILQSLAIVHGDNKPYGVSSGLSTGAAFTLFIVLIRACSFLSNSYILEEGKVANFLLATTGLIKLRYSVMRKTMRKEAFVFLAMVSVLRVSIDIGLTKQAATSQFMSSSPTWMLGLAPDHPALTYAIEIAPILSVAALICVLYVAIARTHSEGIWKYVTVGSMLSYFLIALLWASESKIFGFDGLLQVIGGRNIIPQTVYVIGLVQLFLLASAHMFCSGKDKNWGSRTVALVSACSSPVILLSGKQGSMLALAYLLAGYCIMRLEGVERRTKSDGQNKFSKLDSVCVVQWSLLSVCMFFASGHWCAFDGLRYGAAFVGFDEFVLIRQAILLTIETFGFSIILSVFGLPLLIPSHGEKRHQLFQMYMLYGVISATTVTATILCVTIHRRHLMVWGLFAPKFVFDVVGLILTDVLICLASAFYL